MAFFVIYKAFPNRKFSIRIGCFVFQCGSFKISPCVQCFFYIIFFLFFSIIFIGFLTDWFPCPPKSYCTIWCPCATPLLPSCIIFFGRTYLSVVQLVELHIELLLNGMEVYLCLIFILRPNMYQDIYWNSVLARISLALSLYVCSPYTFTVQVPC